MILLDTTVISELMAPHPNGAVFAFVEAEPRARFCTSAIVKAEILAGVARLPEGRPREALAADARRLFDVEFAGRVLAFGREAATHYAAIVAARRAEGRPLAGVDCLIAATARAAGARIATRNVRDFEGCGVEVVDPWAAP